ncbi:hypothetical protein CI109_101633 [Kwoniella shandongensis]|uniref:Uncharacterized protein n=1 Tax=Kwoniella shandongensis TaxID=1734106 RepID=A0A5M6CBH6_9TREE|nr:uncharacterized protein CI109_001242 [Kwoniella shandongensis]KAA5530439.1 hypothetical protein CI109_001242 [Kwoniella shandongensis]
MPRTTRATRNDHYNQLRVAAKNSHTFARVLRSPIQSEECETINIITSNPAHCPSSHTGHLYQDSWGNPSDCVWGEAPVSQTTSGHRRNETKHEERKTEEKQEKVCAIAGPCDVYCTDWTPFFARTRGQIRVFPRRHDRIQSSSSPPSSSFLKQQSKSTSNPYKNTTDCRNQEISRSTWSETSYWADRQSGHRSSAPPSPPLRTRRQTDEEGHLPHVGVPQPHSGRVYLTDSRDRHLTTEFNETIKASDPPASSPPSDQRPLVELETPSEDTKRRKMTNSLEAIMERIRQAMDHPVVRLPHHQSDSTGGGRMLDTVSPYESSRSIQRLNSSDMEAGEGKGRERRDKNSLSSLEEERLAFEQGLADVQRRMEHEARVYQKDLHQKLQQQDQALAQAWTLLNQLLPAASSHTSFGTSSQLTNSPHWPSTKHHHTSADPSAASFEIASLKHRLDETKRDLSNEIERRKKIELDCDSAKKGQSAQAKMAHDNEIRARDAEDRAKVERERKEELERRLEEVESQSKADPMLVRELELKKIHLASAIREKQEHLSKVRSAQHEYSKLTDKLKALRLEKEALQARVTELVTQNQELEKVKEDKKVLKDALTKERATTTRLRKERDHYRNAAHANQRRSNIDKLVHPPPRTPITKVAVLQPTLGSSVTPALCQVRSSTQDDESDFGPPMVIDESGEEQEPPRAGDDAMDYHSWQKDSTWVPIYARSDIKPPALSLTPIRPSMSSGVLEPERMRAEQVNSLLGPELSEPKKDITPIKVETKRESKEDYARTSAHRATQLQLKELAALNADPFADLGQAFGLDISKSSGSVRSGSPVNFARPWGSMIL